MIIILLINLISLLLGGIFSWLPIVNKLPNIVGYDIDTALVNGVGYTQTFMQTFWPLEIMFQGFLVLMGYYGIKMIVRFFLGHRAPGNHS